MLSIRKIILLLVPLGFFALLEGMTYDNRFFPLLDKHILRRKDASFFFRLQPFIMTGNSGFASDEFRDQTGNDDIGLFDISGRYRLREIDRALQAAGITNRSLIPDNLHGHPLPWSLQGELDAAGTAVSWYWSFFPCWEIGGSFLFMGARSRVEPFPRVEELTLGLAAREELFEAFENSNQANNLNNFLWSNAGFGDLDFYLRWGYRSEYNFLKTKIFDAGVKWGFIAPVAERRDITRPGSFPFGGDGHWGMYWDFAVDTELKEDMFAGFNLRLIKRIKRNQEIRVPVFTEPSNFGVLTETVSINPGLTFVFSPYFGIGDVRDGFGAELGYTLILHDKDRFRSLRDEGNESLGNLDLLRQRSSWGSEYLTCSLLYDFAYNKECRGSLPLLSLDIDIPVGFLVAERANRTFGVSLRIESDLW